MNTTFSGTKPGNGNSGHVSERQKSAGNYVTGRLTVSGILPKRLPVKLSGLISHLVRAWLNGKDRNLSNLPLLLKKLTPSE